MTTALLRPRSEAPGKPLIPEFVSPERCDSFAQSSDSERWTSPSGRSVDTFLPANESDTGEWR